MKNMRTNRSRILLGIIVVFLVGYLVVVQMMRKPKSIAVAQPAPLVLSGTIEPLTNAQLDDIKLNVTNGGGTATVKRERDLRWTLPSAISSGQLGQAYQWYEDHFFVFANQQNSNLPIADFHGPFLFAGILMTIDGGKTWNALAHSPSYTISNRPIHPNPVGLYTSKNKLTVDFADDDGAGSGEGELSRYVSSDGNTWRLTQCSYYVPETYQTPDYEPSVLKATACSKEIPKKL